MRIFLFGEVVNRAALYQEIFNYELSYVPLKYLGLHVWKLVIEKIEKKCACWQGRLLNIAGRITVVQPFLTNTPLFTMSFYPIPDGIRKKADFLELGWFGGPLKIRKKISSSKLGNLLYAKARGGLGILNLQLFNKALLAKWFWKLEIESGLWQEVLLSKYVKGKCIYGIKPKVVDSHFYQHVKRKIGDDKNTRFWEDWWVGSKPLK